MVIQKADALEFVQSLPGGWDVIYLDPPYITEGANHKYNNTVRTHISKGIRKSNNWLVSDIKRYDPTLQGINDNFQKLKNLIKSKMPINAIFIEQNKIIKDYWDKYIIWDKGITYSFPHKICSNHAYFGFNFYGNSWAKLDKGQLMFVEYHIPPNKGNNQYSKKQGMAVPQSLINKLYLWSKASYVLDPFAGSYVTAKVCNRLNIKFDTCDKYLDPPVFHKKINLLDYE